MLAFHEILVPVDFSDCTAKSVECAKQLASRFDAKVEVLHVRRPPATAVPELGVVVPYPGATLDEDFSKRESTNMLDALFSTFELDAHFSKLTLEGDPEQTILNLAHEKGVDLIVMGTHGRKGLSRWIQGSIAEKVVRQSSCPVLVVHP